MYYVIRNVGSGTLYLKSLQSDKSDTIGRWNHERRDCVVFTESQASAMVALLITTMPRIAHELTYLSVELAALKEELHPFDFARLYEGPW